MYVGGEGACGGCGVCEAYVYGGVCGWLYGVEEVLDFGGVGFGVGSVFDGGYGVEACGELYVGCGGGVDGVGEGGDFDGGGDGVVLGEEHVFGEGEEGEAYGHGYG